MRTSVTLVTLTVALSLTAAAQQGLSDSDRIVVIQVVTQNGYKDTPAQLAALRKAVYSAPPREVAVNPNDDISEVISREFRFGQNSRFRNAALGEDVSLRESYETVAAAIRGLNGADFRKATLKGTVLIPDIPKWSDSNYSPSKLQNRVPKTATYHESQIKVIEGLAHPPQIIITGQAEVVDLGREHTQSVRTEYRMRAGDARLLALINPEFRAASTAFNFPLTASLAFGDEPSAGPPVPLRPLMSADDEDAIRTFLRATQRRVWLFVLDTGWPSRERGQAAAKELTTIVNAVLATNSFSSVVIPEPAFTVPTNPHCIYVEQSLKDLEKLDVPAPEQRVKVVFVPLTLGQGAGPFLEAMLKAYELYQIAKQKGVPGRVVLSQDDEARAKAKAQIVTAGLQKEWPPKQRSVLTDKAVIDAILWLANAYAGLPGVQSAFFVNESWTALPEQYEVAYPRDIRGAVVAATGNNGDDVVGKGVDFARRCFKPKDTIAVVNLEMGRKACGSGFVDASQLADSFVLGFSGRIREGHCEDDASGTSFSAPRVGWVLAAGEAVRRNPIDLTQWSKTAYETSLKRRTTVDLTGTGLDAAGLLRSLASP